MTILIALIAIVLDLYSDSYKNVMDPVLSRTDSLISVCGRDKSPFRPILEEHHL